MNEWPDWFPLALFAGWSVVYFISAWAKRRRYRKYQREHWLAAEAVKHFMMATAFFMGALIVGPHPAIDFHALIPYSRFLWLAAFIPAVVAVVLDLRSQARIDWERQQQA